MKSSPPDLWAHKAHALLLPTPLARPQAALFDEDDAAEVARAEEVVVLLREHGLGVSEWTDDARQLHRRAHRDAYDAHVEATSVTGAATSLVHPLSGELLDGKPSSSDAEAWQWFLDLLRKCLQAAGGDPAASYRALWLAVMGLRSDPFGLAHRPGHPLFNDHSIFAHRSAAAALVGARLGGDEAALLHLHVGPVQGFIASARRTHDLSLGSYIIAYLSFHAAEAIAKELGPDAILYPDLAALALYAGGEPIRKLRASLPNRFMAIVPGTRAEAIAGCAAKAVGDTWTAIGEGVRCGILDAVKTSAPPLVSDAAHALGKRFDTQLAHHLEIDATLHAWGSPDGYAGPFKTVRNALTAQRRLVTDLAPTGSHGDKCTQCGDREQLDVVREHYTSGRNRYDRRRFWPNLREALDRNFHGGGKTTGAEVTDESPAGETVDLRAGESLCAVCVTKRFANRWYFGRADERGSALKLDWSKQKVDRLLLRFPSVASIASAPVRSAIERSRIDTASWWKSLRRCHQELGFTPPGNLLPGLGGPGRTGSHLDADGTWYYDTSYEPDTALRDHGALAPSEELARALRGARGKLATVLHSLAESAGRPGVHVTPYYAVISLDVDRMGKWLDGSHDHSLRRKNFDPTINDPEARRAITPALHREISRRQSHLASNPIYAIVEQENLGRVIYSGGDDVLAFVPLATLWRCLDALLLRFQAVEDGLGAKITLSAGVAITHWRAPLSRALQLARSAEEKAKNGGRCSTNVCGKNIIANKTMTSDTGRDRMVITIDRRSGAQESVVARWSLPERLTDLSVLAELTSDRQATEETDDRSASPRIRLGTLGRLEAELRHLRGFRDPKEAASAMRARVAVHLTGRRSAQLTQTGPLLEHLLSLCTPERADELVPLLHLLRFLAREHDPVVAAALPAPTEVSP